MHHFEYKNGILHTEDISIPDIAAHVGTPFYCYSTATLKRHYRVFADAFSFNDTLVCFSVKSNSNLAIIKTLGCEGAGADIVSAGELHRALAAGIAPDRIVFSGVGKSRDELTFALETGILQFNVESIPELETLDKIAREIRVKAPVALRVNPDVDAGTHNKISTGRAENKFGIDTNLAYDLFVRSSKLKNIKLTGIDMHIGSQITNIEPFVEATIKMAELYKKIQSAGIPLKHFDVGGGIGILYKDEMPFTTKEFAEKMTPIFMQMDAEIFFEPGRFLTANGGVLITEVLFTKKNSLGKNFIVVEIIFFGEFVYSCGYILFCFYSQCFFNNFANKKLH